MNLRSWLKRRLDVEGGESTDAPPNAALVDALLGREEHAPALGEFTAATYPAELSELGLRRQQVTDEVLQLDFTNAAARVAALPRLRELLTVYPHPLVYELLIHAYLDERRYDEARGVAFAAQARRAEVAKSPYLEIRSETEHLDDWTPQEVERIREEREGHHGG
jgi:hypothetical protein